jgi:hypothetical protein
MSKKQKLSKSGRRQLTMSETQFNDLYQTSVLNINNFNKQLESSTFGMFSEEGTKRVSDIVKQSKTYYQAILKLIKLSEEDGFDEAMDTIVRDNVIVCYVPEDITQIGVNGIFPATTKPIEQSDYSPTEK